MSVKVSQKAKDVMWAAAHFGEILQDAVDFMVEDLRGDVTRNGALIAKNFERPAQTQRVYTALKKKTKRLKKKDGKPHALNQTGKLKKKTLKTMRGKIRGNKIEMKANTTKYGKFHQPDGTAFEPEKGAFDDGFPIRRFFEIKRRDKPQMVKVSKRAFKKALRKNRIVL